MSGWIEYDSNNSGGSFWLKDEDWKKLEEAGWHVYWIVATQQDLSEYGSEKEYVSADSGRMYAETREEAFSRHQVGAERWPGLERLRSEAIVDVAHTYDEAEALRERHGGYFGQLAVSAARAGDNRAELVAEWESITGQNATDEGCNCCGAPHRFGWHDDDGSTSRGYVQVTQREMVWS